MIEEKKHEHNFLFCEENDYKLYQGKMQDVLDTFQEESVDCIITDPPYELNFMSWDNSGVAFDKETWKHCFRVLKEGGYLLAFGGSRTFHRIACAIEDAGFEIRDCIMWIYGSGMPKSMNLGLKMDKKQGCPDRGHRIAVANRHHPNGTYEPNGENLPPYEAKTELGKKWQGWGTCLKPAYEPIIVARKPFKGSLVDNVIKNGVGGLNIDECRVENTNADTYDLEKRQISKATGSDNDGHFLDQLHNKDLKHGVAEQGRFPANVILTYDETDFEEVCGGFPDTKSGSKLITNKEVNRKSLTSKNPIFNFKTNIKNDGISNYGDKGSASRYFYCAKAATKDRDEGLDLVGFEKVQITDGSVRANPETGRAFSANPTPRRNIHPTVKPTEIMEYLIKLVAPKGSVILDPFMGSGSTGKAVMFQNRERNANYKFIGIEMTPEYLPICQARIDFAKNKYEYETKKELEEQRKTNGQQNIFDFL